MNPLTNVRNIAKLNDDDLKNKRFDAHLSWHAQYKDSAYIFIGGLPYDLTEGDVLCVFSQYGEVVNIHLVRDKKTGKFKGYGFLCYEDQRSTILAVDNFNGIKLGGRTIRVDHVSQYRVPKSDEKDELGNFKDKIETGCAPKTPSPQPSGDELLNSDVSKHKKKKDKDKKKKKKKKKNKKSGDDSASGDDRTNGKSADSKYNKEDSQDRKKSNSKWDQTSPDHKEASLKRHRSRSRSRERKRSRSRSRERKRSRSRERKRSPSPSMQKNKRARSNSRERKLNRSSEDYRRDKGRDRDRSRDRGRGRSPDYKRKR